MPVPNRRVPPRFVAGTRAAVNIRQIGLLHARAMDLHGGDPGKDRLGGSFDGGTSAMRRDLSWQMEYLGRRE